MAPESHDCGAFRASPPEGVLDVGGWPPVGVRGLARSASWTALLPGAILVAFGFQVTHGLVVYLLGPKLETSTSLYGALGVVATVLFFMWVVGRIVVSAPIPNRASMASSADRPGRQERAGALAHYAPPSEQAFSLGSRIGTSTPTQNGASTRPRPLAVQTRGSRTRSSRRRRRHGVDPGDRSGDRLRASEGSSGPSKAGSFFTAHMPDMQGKAASKRDPGHCGRKP